MYTVSLSPFDRAPLDASHRVAAPALARQTLASTSIHGPNDWGNPGTLGDHVARHGADFGTSDPRRYAQLAHRFIERAHQPGNGDEIKRNGDDGSIRVYDPTTGTFGAYNADDSTRTLFKPRNGQAYFDRQPGDVIATAA